MMTWILRPASNQLSRSFARSLPAVRESRRYLGSAAKDSELVNFSVTPAEEGASGFVTAVAAR